MSIGGGNTNTQGTGQGGVQTAASFFNSPMAQQILQQYMQGQQQQTAQNNALYGGQGYGTAGSYYGPPAAGGGAPATSQTPGGGVSAAGPAPAASMAGGNLDKKPEEGDGGAGTQPTTPTMPGIPGIPGFDYNANSTGNAAPTGGLVGAYQGLQNDPWSAGGTGPSGERESDVLGSYDWMSSGLRNQPESDVYGTTGGIAAGPNANERSLYDTTGQFGANKGQDQATAENVYNHETGPNAGYDDATKAALTRESMGATRSPFEQARDRMLQSAAARGNVGSTQGAEIQMANNEAGALGSTAAKNQIAQAQEAIRQRETGAAGLTGLQAQENARKATAIGAQAGQNAQQAGQRLSALGQQNQQNQQQRQTALSGAQGKESMFNTMAGRKQAGTAGLSDLYKTGQQVQAGQQAGAAGLGTQKIGDTTFFGNQSNTGTGNWSV